MEGHRDETQKILPDVPTNTTAGTGDLNQKLPKLLVSILVHGMQGKEKNQTSRRETMTEDRNTDSRMASSWQPEDNLELITTSQQDPQRKGKRANRDNTTETHLSSESPLPKL